MEKKLNLAMAILWGIVTLFAVLAFFWNTAQIFVAIATASMCALHIYEYCKK